MKVGTDQEEKILITEWLIISLLNSKRDIQEKNSLQIRRLRSACERAKRTLSTATQASVEIDALYDFFFIQVLQELNLKNYVWTYF